MIKLSIYLPKESIDEVEHHQDLISDLGDVLVNRGFGNEITEEIEEGSSASKFVSKFISYIIITDEETEPLETLTDAYLIIPLKDEKDG